MPYHTTRRATLDASATHERELYRSYAPFIRRLGLRQGVHDADADDLVQRVFLVFFSKLVRIRPGCERAYLLSIAMREAGHVRRTYSRRAETESEALGPASSGALRIDEQVHRRHLLARASLALSELAEPVRKTWLAFELAGRSCRQIASSDGVPLGTVKSRLRRARRELKMLVAS